MTTTVLVVEDDADILSSMVDILSDDGYRVVGAADGASALKWLRGEPTPPAMILLDLMLPIMDGRQFGAALKRSAEWASIPVVIFSAAVNAREEVAAMGAVGVLRKPVQLQALLEAVQRVAGVASA